MRPTFLALALAAAIVAPIVTPLAATAQRTPRTPPPRPVAAQVDWTSVVERTAAGGFRMGNPDARLRLVEYLSLTCSHCATFAADSAGSLTREHVASGRVSVEYRPFVLNTYDVAASVLARCASPQRHFALTNALLARQAEWTGRIDRLTVAQRTEAEASPTPASMARVAEWLGLKSIAAAHGVTPAAAGRCLADRARLDEVLTMRRAGERLGVTGTPSFLLNDRLLPTHDWASLQPLLRTP